MDNRTPPQKVVIRVYSLSAASNARKHELLEPQRVVRMECVRAECAQSARCISPSDRVNFKLAISWREFAPSNPGTLLRLPAVQQCCRVLSWSHGQRLLHMIIPILIAQPFYPIPILIAQMQH
jgi:hypothetical protein